MNMCVLLCFDINLVMSCKFMISDERKSALLQHSKIAQFMRWLCEPDTILYTLQDELGSFLPYNIVARDEKMGHLLCVFWCKIAL